MLSFDIRSLESHAAQVNGRLSPDDGVWEEGDLRPVGPLLVEGRLSAAGASRFYFSGAFSGESELACRRCLRDVRFKVGEDAHFIFSSEGEDAGDDPDVYGFDAHAATLDLKPPVREAWLLAVPSFVLCRENCRGLCATCGIDLNTESCNCAPVATENRWDALRAIRDQLPR